MRVALLLVALLLGGCSLDFPYESRIQRTVEEQEMIQDELKQIEAALPVIAERKARVLQLQAEAKTLKAEIKKLESKAPQPH